MSRPSLVCVPFAGAGASYFRPWAEHVEPAFDLVPLPLPGREREIGAEPFRDASVAADFLRDAVIERVGTGEIVLFGHSLGAVLAYELAHRLADVPGIDLRRLVVSGSPGPWSTRRQRATGLADAEFLDQVREFAGYDHPALRFPEMRELILPALRADVEMHENYRPSRTEPLPVPITSLRGRDDELVDTEHAGQWSKATTGDFDLVELPGGHMYLTDSVGTVAELITAALSEADGNSWTIGTSAT
ncbi:alpha/beta fold hydrolase [Saccharopolyspora sp. NPDC047091]|uniref:thioesterase II family protein n=1 Tax=Saccharopolyspora sp. NPDC047091 TaxID=3155924 RepID=UPI0033C2210A